MTVFGFSKPYCAFWLSVAGWEVPRPKEEIPAVAAGARHQTSRCRRGRTETFEPGQNNGLCRVGRDGRRDFFPQPEGKTGWADVMWRTRGHCRGDYKISSLFYSVLFLSPCKRTKLIVWKAGMIQQQHWVLKCNWLSLPSPQDTVLTLHASDALLSIQGHLCQWTLVPVPNDGPVVRHLHRGTLWDRKKKKKKLFCWGKSKSATPRRKRRSKGLCLYIKGRSVLN